MSSRESMHDAQACAGRAVPLDCETQAGGPSRLRLEPFEGEVLLPTYQAGEHKVDHPPLFACREHKNFLRLTTSFIEEIVTQAADVMPGNLAEIAAPYVGGNQDAFKLPDYLIPPRVILYNPDGLRGPLALPFTLIFIDKRFVGIPAAYLTQDRFEGCAECAVAARQEEETSWQEHPRQGAAARPAAPARPVASPHGGSGFLKPGTVPAPARRVAAGPNQTPHSGGVPLAKRPPGATPPGGSRASDALKGPPKKPLPPSK